MESWGFSHDIQETLPPGRGAPSRSDVSRGMGSVDSQGCVRCNKNNRKQLDLVQCLPDSGSLCITSSVCYTVTNFLALLLQWCFFFFLLTYFFLLKNFTYVSKGNDISQIYFTTYSFLMFITVSLILVKLAQVTHFGKPWLIANGLDLWSQTVTRSLFLTEIC